MWYVLCHVSSAKLNTKIFKSLTIKDLRFPMISVSTVNTWINRPPIEKAAHGVTAGSVMERNGSKSRKTKGAIDKSIH